MDTKIRNNFKNEILNFVNNNGETIQEKKYLASSIYHSEDSKRWGSLARGILVIILSNEDKSAYQNAIGIELIHHASLIVDDVIDRAVVRRGHSSFWIRHGENEAILFAHKLINYAYSMIDADKALFNTIDSMLNSELTAQKRKINSVEEYIEMARQRTGKLFALTVDLSLNFNKSLNSNYSAIHDAFEKIGITHQMLDDRLDYLDPEYFESNDAFQKEKCINYYALKELGYSQEYLSCVHKKLGIIAIKDIENLVFVDLKKYLIELCYKIAFGSRKGTSNKIKNFHIHS